LKPEQEYWTEIEPILRGIVREIRDRGWFRAKKDLEREKETGQQMMTILARVNTHLFMTNDFTNAMELNAQATVEGLNKCLRYSKEDVFRLWIYEMFSIFLESTELFTKNLMILINPTKPFWPKMTFLGLIRILEKHCPKFGPKLAEQANPQLRNSIAHGIWWVIVNDDGSIDMFHSEEVGNPPIKEPLDAVLVRVRKHNLMSCCLSELLGSEIEGGLLG
jgi:hypothetical protein